MKSADAKGIPNILAGIIRRAAPLVVWLDHSGPTHQHNLELLMSALGPAHIARIVLLG